MTVPLLHHDYGSAAPKRAGLKHPSIAPYGAFNCADGRQVVIAIQNEREWGRLCTIVLGNSSTATDPHFSLNSLRVADRSALDAEVARVGRPPRSTSHLCRSAAIVDGRAVTGRIAGGNPRRIRVSSTKCPREGISSIGIRTVNGSGVASTDKKAPASRGCCVAETVGFEPTIESPLYTLSRRAPSTTRPRLRIPFGHARQYPLINAFARARDLQYRVP